jgi:hypothetical protein
MSDLKDLEPLSKRLNAASDELQQALDQIQDRLNRIGIGIEVWVEAPALTTSESREILDRDSEPTGSTEYDVEELGYGRLGDSWALLVRSRRIFSSTDGTVETFEDDPQPKSLLRASRALRVAAVTAIPRLIDQLEQAAEATISRVEQAKKIADSLK